MLQPILKELSAIRVVLASGSPRRQELVKNMGINAILFPSTFEENLKLDDFPSFSAFVEETALQKVLNVHERLSGERPPDGDQQNLIIGADTMVVLNGKMYGKPKTPEVAFKTLSELVGKTNTVYTGVVIKYGDHLVKFTDTAEVTFGKATPAQIQAYVNTGEPLDKAGGYGIQGVGGTMIEKINGDYFTVMGLPLYRLCKEICRIFNYDVDKLV